MSKHRKQKSLPPFFGTTARTEILLILAINGPLHVREIGRLRGVDPGATFKTIQRLVETGVIAKREQSKRVVTLDRSHRAYPRLRTFLLKLANDFPPPRIKAKAHRWGLPLPYGPHAVPKQERLFGQVAKTRSLLGIAAASSINVSDLAAALQTHFLIIWPAVEALERDGLIVSTRVGRERHLRLNEELPAFAEFLAYLRTLIATERPEYEAMRLLMGRRRPRKT